MGESGRNKTVLLIDDSNFMRATIRGILKRNGFRVIGEAENGKIGAEKYKSLRPDFVISDIVMGKDESGISVEDSGMSALESIIAYDSDAKVVIVSSMVGQTSLVDEMKSKGAIAFLGKPVDEEALVGALNAATSTQAL